MTRYASLKMIQRRSRGRRRCRVEVACEPLRGHDIFVRHCEWHASHGAAGGGRKGLSVWASLHIWLLTTSGCNEKPRRPLRLPVSTAGDKAWHSPARPIGCGHAYRNSRRHSVGLLRNGHKGRTAIGRSLRPGLVIVHGHEPGVAKAFAAAAKELGVTAEVRVIDRGTTGFPTVEQRNWELLSGKADMCIAVHSRIADCRKTLDFVYQALKRGIPTYGIENTHAIPRRTVWGDSRLP
jgi:hypothetical protein